MNGQGFVHLDPEFTITRWQAQHVYGYTPREVVGRPGADVLPALIGNRADRIAILERDGAWQGREVHRHKDGRLVLVDYIVKALHKYGQLVGYIAEHHPITDYRILTGGWKSPQNPAQTRATVARQPLYGGRSPRLSSPTVVSTTDGNEVGTRLRQAREAAGLSKEALAKRSGIDRRLIYRWERGDYRPSAESLYRLLPHLGGTIESYLFGD